MKPISFTQPFRTSLMLWVLLFLLSQNGFSNIDTIYAGIPTGQFGVTCIDLSDFSGTIQSITNICPEQDNGNATFNIQSGDTGCVNYFGINDGSSAACIEICDDTPTCDTFFILLNVSTNIPLTNDCDSLILPKVMNISWAACNVDAKICLPIRFDHLTDLEIYDNGVLYNNGITGCNIDTIIAYSYFTLFGQGTVGPYFLDSWTINGEEYSSDFFDVNALLDSMNTWDPMGGWETDSIIPFTIKGGVNENFYGPLIASKPDIINSTSIMGANYGLTPMGSELSLTQGQHLIELVDNANACSDTVLINIVCLPNDYLTIQTYVGFTDELCVDTSDFIGNFFSLKNSCADNNPEVVVDLFPSDNCLDWEAISKGNSQACIVACDDEGFCDTTFITFDILCLTPDTIEIFMDGNATENICVDTSELFSTLNSFQIGYPNNGLTTIELDTNNYCIDISSTTLAGSDTLCVVLCDSVGGCDTTWLFITVGEIDIIAEDDHDSTAFNIPVVIDVLVNDTFALLDTMYVLEQAQHGYVTLDTSGMFLYTPDEDFCGEDIFTYEICDLNGCDMANVILTVSCEQVVVYNGISPNNDGTNDVFQIDGLGGYPNHEVRVYNRWGNMVMEESSYKSSWKGTWKGVRLPQGTYFYTIDLHDDEGTKKTGYLYITH